MTAEAFSPDKTHLLDELRALPTETEWVEFKVDNHPAQEIGEYLSALSNSARLRGRSVGYLVYGIEDKTHEVKGTHFRPRQTKAKGNEDLEPWLARLLDPRVDLRIYEGTYEGHPIVLFEVDAASGSPVKFSGIEYVRIGSHKKRLSEYPEKERQLWSRKGDWSAEFCKNAQINCLDERALLKAREEFKIKHPHLEQEVDGWNDLQFLNKAKLAIEGQLTNAAILLLGKSEADFLLSPAVARITWLLKKDGDSDLDYEHFGPPFILSVEEIFARVRNLRDRYMPNTTLFPIEIDQYDRWVIREALHNCIAHQDYDLRGRVSIVETSDHLVFTNVGHFIPGDLETVIRQDSPPSRYRNPFLCQAMVNLNMIDTIGGGIKKMFLKQRERFFPLPSYELKPEEVKVTIPGRVLDENYTRVLIERADLNLWEVILLDKIQKNNTITKEQSRELRDKGLVEGRYPTVFISAKVAGITKQKVQYIKNRGLDNKHYKELVIQYLRQYHTASREDLDTLLMSKLSDVLSISQKKNRIHNLLGEMSRAGIIRNTGSKAVSQWELVDPGL